MIKVEVGCLVITAGRLTSGFYSLWSEDPAAEGGSVCGRFETTDVGLVIDVFASEDQSLSSCACIYTSRGETGWVACRNLRVVSAIADAI